MIKKTKALFALFQAGRVVSDPAKWKGRQIGTSAIVALLWACVQAAGAFGVEIPVDAETVDGVAVFILAGVNLVLTLTTSDKVGVQSRGQPAGRT